MEEKKEEKLAIQQIFMNDSGYHEIAVFGTQLKINGN